jgi:murein DD-endopeptidase MepM/ murein hydrolase activator NlpD
MKPVFDEYIKVYWSQKGVIFSGIISNCTPMLSLKTKDVPPKRTFLIVLSLLAVSAFAFSAHTLIADPKASPLVKDEAVVAPGIIEEQGSGDAVPLTAQDDKPVITTYVVKKGDTLSSIASQFSISTNTLLWANDLTKKSVIKEGQKLTILPISGVMYTVAKKDTLSGIAVKFDASVEEIVSFNDLEDTKTIKVGMKLIIPNAELPLEKPVAKPVEKVVKAEVKKEVVKEQAPAVAPTHAIDTDDAKTVVETKTPPDGEAKGYFTMPIPGAVLTQGAHGYNGVDFGAAVGTPVLAAAAGKVIVAKTAGYGGGYGHYIVIEHDNGAQTLYAHLSTLSVAVDDEVTKGQKIALSGNTGRSTGPHLHFEVRGGVNPWIGFKKLTQF